MGEQSEHGHQNVQFGGDVNAPVSITFTGQPMPDRALGASVLKLRFGVPPVAAAFAGRSEELETLERALAAEGRALVTQAITGLGGVGKTQLAARYVHAHAEEYDIVAWIHAEDGAVADLARLAVKLGERVEGLSPAERRDLALERLARGQERWLLVLDNIDSPGQLPDCRPQAGNGRVLITSRNRAVREFAPVLPLDVFDPETAVQYLAGRAQRPHDRDGAERLARALGYLPLALSHAAAYCLSGTSFDDYLELLEALPAQELSDNSPGASYTQTVASTWKASIQAASASAPLAGELLALAAHLGPDAIPKSLFDVVIDPGVALEQKRLGDGLNALARFSLASVDDESVSVHRLLAKVVREDARARGDLTALKRAVVALGHAFPADPADPAQWPRCERLLAHVIALADAAAGVPDTAERVIALLNRACLYLNWAEDGARGLALTQSTVKQAASILGAEHPSTLTARSREATASQQTGQLSPNARKIAAYCRRDAHGDPLGFSEQVPLLDLVRRRRRDRHDIRELAGDHAVDELELHQRLARGEQQLQRLPHPLAVCIRESSHSGLR